jgi:choline-sulfatase
MGRVRSRSRSFAVWTAVALLAGVMVFVVARSRPGEVRRQAGLDVLLITVDTLRADALGAYGNAKGATPWMDRLAAQGAVFRQAHAHNVVTLPSHSNILSGRHPFEHGVRDNAGFRFPRGMDTLATLLKDHGYRTGAFVSAFTLDSRFGLDRGFDVYDDAFAAGSAHAAFVLPERRGEETVAAARRWLARGDGRPSFCWVHLYDPHAPYAPREPFATRFAGDAYLGDVAESDAALGPLLEPLLSGAGAAGTLVVLTADHGESLGEHGERAHGIFAYEPTLRVPLVLHAPGIVRAGVLFGPAAHVDVLPTVLDALALPRPEGLPGRSLLADTAGHEAPSVPTYFEALSGLTTRGWAPLYGVIRDRAKYIDLPLPELYDLAADPGETRNRIASEAARLAQAQAALARFRAGDGGVRRAEETGDTRARLQALGYLAAAPTVKARHGPEDDPKRLIEIDAMLETVIARHRAGDVSGALQLCEEVVRRRGDMPAALVQLALLQRKAGRLEPAVAALRRAVALSPEDAAAAALLGSYLNEAGLAAEAAALLEPYAARPDPSFDALLAQGVAFARLGRGREALAAFERAHAVDASNPMPLVQAATVHMLAGRDADARRSLEGALAVAPDQALAHHNLGLLAARRGDTEEASRRFRRALLLNPAEHDALLQLGLLLVRQGRRAEARPFLESFLAGAPRPLYDREIARVEAWLKRSAGA